MIIVQMVNIIYKLYHVQSKFKTLFKIYRRYQYYSYLKLKQIWTHNSKLSKKVIFLLTLNQLITKTFLNSNQTEIKFMIFTSKFNSQKFRLFHNKFIVQFFENVINMF